jgi:hypothetical protein
MIISRNVANLLATTAAVTSCAHMALAQDATGPSSSQSPYVISAAPGVLTRSILTVGDSVNNKPNGTPYRMVGIPDGLGAYDNGDKTFTVLMNHELREGVGVAREHGANGAFISKWTIDKKTLRVLHGEDLIQYVATWDPAVAAYNPFTRDVAFNPRIALGSPLLSNSGAAVSFLLHAAEQPPSVSDFSAQEQQPVGYNGRLFTNGEEVGEEGRAFAHTLDGYTYELPRMGKCSWGKCCPSSGQRSEKRHHWLGRFHARPGVCLCWRQDQRRQRR